MKKASRQATAQRFHETVSVQVFVSTIYKEYRIPWWLRRESLPAERETCVRSLGREDPLEKEMATRSSILAWRIPWMEETGRLQVQGSQSQTDWATSGYTKIFNGEKLWPQEGALSLAKPSCMFGNRRRSTLGWKPFTQPNWVCSAAGSKANLLTQVIMKERASFIAGTKQGVQATSAVKTWTHSPMIFRERFLETG